MPRFKVRSWFLLPLMVAWVAAACGNPTSTAPSGESVAPSFPLSVTAANGKVTIPHLPTRIVSLSATATEDLYAVGAGKQVVAVDSYSNYPPQAPRTHLSGFTPNIEAIAKYRPDLVLIDTDSNHIVRELGKVGIPVLGEPP